MEVSIPLKSGLCCYTGMAGGDDWYAGFNPFEIRALLLHFRSAIPRVGERFNPFEIRALLLPTL